MDSGHSDKGRGCLPVRDSSAKMVQPSTWDLFKHPHQTSVLRPRIGRLVYSDGCVFLKILFFSLLFWSSSFHNFWEWYAGEKHDEGTEGDERGLLENPLDIGGRNLSLQSCLIHGIFWVDGYVSGYTSSAWLRRTKTPTLPRRISARGLCIFIGYTCIRTECALFAKMSHANAAFALQ
jgi:hypothetical protein